MHSNTTSELQAILKKAITEFNHHETYLIKNDLSERCICAKFAQCLDKILTTSTYNTYCVDVEYNRNANHKNYIKSLRGKNIVVDLIVHKRGTQDNLICIEFKKAYTQVSLDSDKNRLRTLVGDKNVYGYKLGAMILIDRDIKNNIYCLRVEDVFFPINL